MLKGGESVRPEAVPARVRDAVEQPPADLGGDGCEQDPVPEEPGGDNQPATWPGRSDRSTHSTEQVEAAITAAPGRSGLDFCVGPVWATPTKPGRAAVGLDLVRYAADTATVVPWFAIGGIDLGNVEQVLAAGARRVVVVRAITESEDPAGAARTLLAALDAAAN